MPITNIEAWLDEYSQEGTVWYAKRLAGNDTLATGSNQAGPYLPKEFLFSIFPQINRPQAVNPDAYINVYIDSHSDFREVRVIWYNNRVRINPDTGRPLGTRNETRMTGFGGQASAVLDPDSTGSIAIFVFLLNEQGIARECHIWICGNEVEEDIVESRLGPIEPKLFMTWRPGLAAGLVTTVTAGPVSCRLTREQIPAAWLARFPSGLEIVEKARELRPDDQFPVDERLVRRRDCEYEIFRCVEEAFYLPRIGEGFQSINSFISLAQTILQSRKARSGKSLELHASHIFTEETLVPERHFSHSPIIEGNKRPDFLFPNTAAYNDPAFPAERLRMLAVKTTAKDRWRQILTEASRIPNKHLLTLQEGVSENQFREMRDEGVTLVVPPSLYARYPTSVQPHLISLESFIAEVRSLSLG
jgi:hypothetical protein